MRLALSGEYQANFSKSCFRRRFTLLKGQKIETGGQARKMPKKSFFFAEMGCIYIRPIYIKILTTFWHFGTPYCGCMLRNFIFGNQPLLPSTFLCFEFQILYILIFHNYIFVLYIYVLYFENLSLLPSTLVTSCRHLDPLKMLKVAANILFIR